MTREEMYAKLRPNGGLGPSEDEMLMEGWHPCPWTTGEEHESMVALHDAKGELVCRLNGGSPFRHQAGIREIADFILRKVNGEGG